MRVLKEVNTAPLADLFVSFVPSLYKEDENYIRPLDKDIHKVFDVNENKFFKHGSLCRWILFEDGKPIGRVAAFINERTAHTFEQPTGGMGFFECIDDKEAAFILMKKCQEWLEKRGMEAMDGPINFGERNAWWGLLVEGFKPPTYLMAYNPSYYQSFFEQYGFQTYFNQYSFEYNILKADLSRYKDKVRKISNNSDYTFEHVDKRNLKKYAKDFIAVYNQAWGKHDNFKEMKEEQGMKLMEAMKPVMVDYLIWFGYYKNEPISFFITIPDLNQYFKYINGKLNFMGKLTFLYHKLRRTNKRAFGTIFGVVPKHQGMGVEAGMILNFVNQVVEKGNRWKTMELTWLGDFNPKMLKLAKNLGGTVSKTHKTYRKLFDSSRPFERCPMLD